MKEFTLYYGLVADDEYLEKTDLFENEEDANEAARVLACEEYAIRPSRTIEEIIDDEDVDADEAKMIFDEEMEENIDFYVDPIEEVEEDEDNEVPDHLDEY
jgi:hypothetical protein